MAAVSVKRSIELIHTFLTYWTSGWYFGGINIMINLSTSWIPDSEHTPRYKSTPNITGTGMRLSAGAKRIEIPVTQVNSMWKCVNKLIIIIIIIIIIVIILYHELNTNNNNINKNYYLVVVVLGRKVWLVEISSNHQNYKHVTTFLVCFSSKTDLHEIKLNMLICSIADSSQSQFLPVSTCIAMLVTLCSFTSTIWGFTPGAWDVLQIVNDCRWETERTVAAHIQGSPIKEQINDNSPITHRSKLKPAPLRSLFSFLFIRTPVSSVSINNKIPMNKAGIIAAKIQPDPIGFVMPPGLINHPLSLFRDGVKPVWNGSPMEIFCVVTLSWTKMSRSNMEAIAMTIPKSLTSLLA